jgi:sec-independent protein translocase protein TatC
MPLDQPQEQDGSMPFLDHLEELRWRLLRCIVALMGGTLAGFAIVYRYDPIEWLIQPIKPYLPGGRLMATDIAGPIAIYTKLAFTIGVAIALPVTLYQAWAFISPALRRHERRAAVTVIGASTLLFVAGAALAFFYAVPSTLGLSDHLTRSSLTMVPEAGQYFETLTSFVLIFGLAFEVPVVLVGLAAVGLLSSRQLARGRRFAAAGVFLFAAIITPGDAMTTNFILAGPLYLLFEASIIVSWLMERRRRAAGAAGLDADDRNALALVGLLAPSILQRAHASRFAAA